MSSTVAALLLLLSGTTATTYGWGESECANELPCVKGTTTSSGEEFDPALPTVAVALPVAYRIRARTVWLRTETGACTKLRLNDRMSGLSKGRVGWDLTPAAVRAIGGTPSKSWSARVFMCAGLSGQNRPTF